MKKPSLFLHICCGPCATTVVHRLKSEYEITGFFYNPNIFPEQEYHRRLEAAERLAQTYRFNLLTDCYDHDSFLAAVRGLEGELEGGRRCEVCYRLRLKKSALKAKALGFSFLASTLTVGRNKRADLINRLGFEVCAPYEMEFLSADWKKANGFRQSMELSQQLGLYRQHYCGCEFSFRL
ncbi:MAG: epoxyqueuosine reductase QueH [bacterium]